MTKKFLHCNKRVTLTLAKLFNPKFQQEFKGSRKQAVCRLKSISTFMQYQMFIAVNSTPKILRKSFSIKFFARQAHNQKLSSGGAFF